jgi:hypothetical protein
MSKKFYDEVCAIMARLEVEDVVITKVREIAQWFADNHFAVVLDVATGIFQISVPSEEVPECWCI